MNTNAIILTAGTLTGSNAKTAHGLIRSSGRYTIIGVIDDKTAGRDAGEVLDKITRDIPIYASLGDFQRRSDKRAQYAVVGVAFAGGKLPAPILDQIRDAIQAGISIVSGAHDFLSDMPDIRQLAAENGVTLLDIRKPRPKDQLKFWSGAIMEVTAPVIAVMGTDCALGKRTTAVMITGAMKEKGVRAEMIFTGQTGWLQGHRYGFVLDSTYNDFISGELEHAVVSCWKETDADVIFIEGQSALCNPSGPCGSELLLSAQCKGVILQHAPGRIYYKGKESTGNKISLARELELIRLYGSRVLAITLNTAKLTAEEARGYQERLENEFGLPVILPLEDGMHRLSEIVREYVATFKNIPFKSTPS
ncbi:DUF1611 domain-containing protein [Flavitalea sp. BT771]|uniref:DUF1611 domain-containing protein n=1 Tax=Flavitalea sp. BT771 TaxID=3063329 RepID=UPI0026E25A0C|nr:DUF1611 domain-containing protein [Flavitalea sp. BT771]MDO6435216.1 DUF1611 domain-containing protein [Flavitalea sp. BT771]MDV6224079.1 DUF1611 domain-containing protein [Flavitalea sp. BT771]